MDRRAQVYCLGVLAGILSKSRAGYRFHYVPDYLRDSKAPAISLTFPKREAVFESAALFPYFFGLLAEGDNKKVQCRVMKIDEADHFTRLLMTCQTETIGGVTVREIA